MSIDTAFHLRPSTRDPLPPRALRLTTLWCDLDLEFLTTSGHRKIPCRDCGAVAVVRQDGDHLCSEHLTEGLVVPGWLLRSVQAERRREVRSAD